MLKVNFEVSSLVRKNLTGIGVYTKNLIETICKFPDIECSGSYRLSRYKKHQLITDHVQLPIKPYLPMITGYLPSRYDIFHGPDFRIPVGNTFKRVVTIHDMVVFQYELVDKKFADRGIAKMKRTIYRGRPDHIIFVSSFTQQAFLEHFPSWETRSTVIHLGMDHLPLVRNRLNAIYDFPYVLSVGTVEKRKNASRVIDAFEQIASHHSDFRLVIVGGQGMLGGPILEKIFTSPFKDRIIYKGFVSNQELISLYQHATCAVYPSLYEGFGIPILEAMRFSCPVITSNIGAMKEVSGQAAYPVNPFDTESIAAAMTTLIENTSLREQLIDAGNTHIRTFTWQTCAENTVKVYRNLV